jgi:uncharacterized repeat protein (TIGR01451 family)
MKKTIAAVCCAVLGASLSGRATAAAGPSSGASASRVDDVGHRVPLHFEANQGQTDDRVRFLARGPGYGIFLTSTEAVVQLASIARRAGAAERALRQEVVRLRFVGANPRPKVVGVEEMAGKANYFIGGDAARWRTGIPLYARVEYRDVYPGVSLAYYGNPRQLEYDVVLDPGADLRRVRFRIDGARRLRLDAQGNLVVETSRGPMIQRAPVVYEIGVNGRRPLPGRYRLHGKREVGFEVPGHDRRARLVIDPVVLVYSTFLGGSDDDAGRSIALDRDRNAYITGATFSPDFPIAGSPPFQPLPPADYNAFVTKLDEFGGLVYSTYLGGGNFDQGLGIAVNASGDAFVTGSTASDNFPTRNSIQPFTGSDDAFVAVLDPTGSGLVYSTYLGGGDTDFGSGIAVDVNGNTYVTGQTFSGDFPKVNAIQSGLKGPSDAFVARIRFSGVPSLDYSTYLGGADNDNGAGIAVFGTSAYVVGSTSSGDFPSTTGAFQTSYGLAQDAFVARLADDGQSLLFATFLGGKDAEEGTGIAVDGSGEAYVTGQTRSGDFPMEVPAQPLLAGDADAFVSKLRADGSRLVYSTYLGGKLDDVGRGIVVDAAGAAHVAGETVSGDFPRFDDFVPPLSQGAQEVFVTKVAPPGCAFIYSAVFGSSRDDQAGGIAVSGLAASTQDWVAGLTSAADFPIVDPPQPGTIAQPFYGGDPADGFVVRINNDPAAALELKKTDSPDPVFVGGTLTYSLTVKNNGPEGIYGIVVTDSLPGAVSFVGASVVAPAIGFCSESGGVVTCNVDCLSVGDTLEITITVTVSLTAPPLITNNATMSRALSATVLNVSEDTTVLPVTNLKVTKTQTPPVSVNVGDTISYLVTVTNNGPSQATGVVVVDTLPPHVTFVSSTPLACPPSGGIMTCTLPGPLNNGASFSLTIDVKAIAAGTAVNKADVSGAEDDPDSSDNSATATTIIGIPANAIRFFTVTSTSNRNVLEWLNPSGASFGSTVINAKAGSCPTAETEIGATIIVPPASGGGPGAKMTFVHDSTFGGVPPLPAVNGTTYCYAAWVNLNPSGTAGPRYVKARPFDNSPGATDVRWAFSTGATAVVPPGIGPALHMVSNDDSLYAATRGALGGTWPAGWLPLAMNGPSQGRPTTISINVLGATKVIFLGSQDTNVRAIDADVGVPKWIQTLGASNPVQAGPSGWFTAFGATPGLNFILVGTRNTSGDNEFWALDALTGTPAWGAPFTSVAGDRIGIINGQAVVDYAAKRVYFTSYARVAGNSTVWCLDITTGAKIWSKAYGDIAGAPTLRGDKLYVPTNGGLVRALSTVDGSTAWSFSTGGDGMARGFVFLDRLSSQVYFSTNSFVWSVTLGAATPTWKRAIASPSPPLFSASFGRVYVGSSDGKLYSLDAATGAPVPAETNVLGDGLATVGSPSLDVLGRFLYAGSEAGVVYAVQLP